MPECIAAQPVITEQLQHPLLREKGVEVFVRRDDLLHPAISGNKWYKLQPLITQALSRQAKGLVSLGGAYSNHLHALAFAGHHFSLPTVGLIRGELIEPLNPSLVDMKAWGMRLIAVPRSLYKQRNDRDLAQELLGEQGYKTIAEGGAEAEAIAACYQWGCDIAGTDKDYDLVALACGTGTTLAGIARALAGKTPLWGFSALRDRGSIAQRVSCWLDGYEAADWRVIDQYAGPGFGRLYPRLIAFLQGWPSFSHIPLEPLYTGKLMYGLFDMIGTGQITPGSRILVIHTGGIQGARGMAQRYPQHADIILAASGLAQP